MFSILVSGHSTAWETSHEYSMHVPRFKEYSENESKNVSLEDQKSLAALNGTRAILMYEDNFQIPNREKVRIGTLQNVRKVGNEIAFDFTEVGKLAYSDVQEFRLRLALQPAEFTRTHWAIKDGLMPDLLLARAKQDNKCDNTEDPAALAMESKNSSPAAPTVPLITHVTPTRNQVFVSYSHDDEKWLNRFMKMLAPLIRSNSINVWYDGKIKPSQAWRQEIEDAMARASVGVLLVSKHFLASDFISSNELPYLLEAAKQRGVQILWVNVGPSMYEETPLKDIQAVNPPNRPWNRLKGAALDEALKVAARAVKAAVSATRPPPSEIQASASQPSAIQITRRLTELRESLLRLLNATVHDSAKQDQLRRIQIQVMDLYFPTAGHALPLFNPPLTRTKEGQTSLQDWKHLSERIDSPLVPHPIKVGTGTDGKVYGDPAIGVTGWIEHAIAVTGWLIEQVCKPAIEPVIANGSPPPSEEYWPSHLRTLKELFDTDFRLGSVSSSLTIKSLKTGHQYQIPYRILYDFTANSTFLAFFLPNAPDAFEYCKVLAENLHLPFDDINESISMSSHSPGNTAMISLKSLRFTGLVYLYHENHWSLAERATLESLFSSKNATVQFRGHDYHVLHWERKPSVGSSNIPLDRIRHQRDLFDQWATRRTNFERAHSHVNEGENFNHVFPLETQVEMGDLLQSFRTGARELLGLAESYDIDASALREICQNPMSESSVTKRIEIRAILDKLEGAILKEQRISAGMAGKKYEASPAAKSSIPLEEEIEQVHVDPRDIDFPKLVRELDAIAPGKDGAGAFHTFILGALETIFHSSLRNPQKEQEIHEGRKRIDIRFTNAAERGFFFDLTMKHRLVCPYIFVECKNYAKDPANPEFDQLTGRFSDKRGKFGIMVCRSVDDWPAMIARCKDAANDGRGYIIVLDDADIKALLTLRGAKKFVGISDYLEAKLGKILM